MRVPTGQGPQRLYRWVWARELKKEQRFGKVSLSLDKACVCVLPKLGQVAHFTALD